MATAFSGPDHFHHRTIKYLLGGGGIIWEQSGYMLRSSEEGVVWELARDTRHPRTVPLLSLNVNWRGPYIEGRPRYEICWRGEPGRNFHGNANPINRSGYFAINGKVYNTGFSAIIGAAIMQPTTGPDAGKDVLLLATANNAGATLRRCLVTELGPITGTPTFTTVGSLPASGNSLGDSEYRRSIFFSPDGTEARAVWWIMNEPEDMLAYVNGVEFRTFSVDSDAFGWTSAITTYGPYTTLLTVSDTALGSPVDVTWEYFAASTGPTTEVRTWSFQDSYKDGTIALVDGPVTFPIAVDYSPEGSVRILECTYNVEGSFVEGTTFDDIDNFGGDYYEHVNNLTEPTLRLATTMITYTRTIEFTRQGTITMQFSCPYFSWSNTYDFVRDLSSQDAYGEGGYAMPLGNTVASPGRDALEYLDERPGLDGWWWNSLAGDPITFPEDDPYNHWQDWPSDSGATEYGNDIRTLDWETSSISYLDLRYGHMARHAVKSDQPPETAWLDLELFEETTHIYRNGLSEYSQMYVTNPIIVDYGSGLPPTLFFSFEKWEFDWPSRPEGEYTLEVHLAQPDLVTGDPTPYEDTDGNSGSDILHTFAKYRRGVTEPDDYLFDVTLVGQPAATDPYGGFIVVIPSQDTTGPADDVNYVRAWMSGDFDLELTFSEAGVDITSAVGPQNQFVYVRA